MVNIVIDSSVIIEEGRRGSDLYQLVVKLAKTGEVSVFIPAVVIMELWSGSSMKNKLIVEMMESRIKPFIVSNVDEFVAKKAGSIRRECGIGGVDTLIAATTIMQNAELVTLNTKHFVGIKGLKLYNYSK